MQKIITIAGVFLLGSAVASGLAIDEGKLIKGLVHELIDAEKDVKLIKQSLQAIAKKRSRSAPRVERSSSWSKIHHATGALSDLTNAGVAIYGATQIPHVERGFSLHKLGHATGIASDLVNIGTGIYGATQMPRVEGWLSGIGELTGIAGDLTGMGIGIYQTVHPNVESGFYEDDDEIEVEASRGSSSRRGSSSGSRGSSSGSRGSSLLDYANIGSQIIGGLGQAGAGMYAQIMAGQAAAAQQKYYNSQPHVEQYWDGPVYVRPSRVVYNGGMIYPYDE
ncbi:UNKNOWN [Stylonychia lemnae]|uniref:Uncharacterized protein n=1 Tax=Stylonychia lemnae TaxID=5949 RepID=A0A078AFP1_STYLE|nr:UNKNOWN [Stylonychia lemnae]|eukprot:CDW81050.1 UNKNOWN [Stylonychia lemnae]